MQNNSGYREETIKQVLGYRDKIIKLKEQADAAFNCLQENIEEFKSKSYNYSERLYYPFYSQSNLDNVNNLLLMICMHLQKAQYERQENDYVNLESIDNELFEIEELLLSIDQFLQVEPSLMEKTPLSPSNTMKNLVDLENKGELGLRDLPMAVNDPTSKKLRIQ
jgi:hypothetical protein